MYYLCVCPQGAGFSRRGCLNQAAPPLSLFPYVWFLSTGLFNYISFQKLSPRYLGFQRPSYSFFLPNRPFSCIYLQHSSSLYSSSCSLRSPSDPACLPCTAYRVRGGWDPQWWLRSPVWSNTLLRPGLLLDGWLGWPNPINRLVVLCPNFD